jgi:hypothetical protein
MSKRTADEVLKAIDAALAEEKANGNEDDEDVAPWDADMERVLLMSPEERRRIIEEAGIDLSALYARADEVQAKMEAEAAGSQAGARRSRSARDKDVRPRSDDAPESETLGEAWVMDERIQPKRSFGVRWTWLVAATTAAALTGGAVYVAGRMSHRDDRVRDVWADAGPAPSPTPSATPSPVAPQAPAPRNGLPSQSSDDKPTRAPSP